MRTKKIIPFEVRTELVGEGIAVQDAGGQFVALRLSDFSHTDEREALRRVRELFEEYREIAIIPFKNETPKTT